MEKPEAFKEAIKGVDYIIHTCAPIPGNSGQKGLKANQIIKPVEESMK